MKQILLSPLLCVLLIPTIVSRSAAQEPSYDQPWRPQYHFTPPRNFMNDPNGMVFYKGEYHLFYQYNPESNVWGHMSWGHAISSDMVHWQNLPVALHEVPGEYMVHSGSAVVDWNNTSGLCKNSDPHDRSCLIAIYTAAYKDRQKQHIAFSFRDGMCRSARHRTTTACSRLAGGHRDSKPRPARCTRRLVTNSRARGKPPTPAP
jgi:fructan beta-fructosidase